MLIKSKKIIFAYVIFQMITLSACVNVKPYERGYLSDPIMQPNIDVEELSYDQHMHKALAQGAIGIPMSGGGCGCEQ